MRELLVFLLRLCSKSQDLNRGTRLHKYIRKRGLLAECSDALVTMYAKCGALGTANAIFNMYKSRDVYTWTALIAGYAHEGHCQDALKCFEEMQGVGLFPNAVTYCCMLKVCGIIGHADRGREIHDEITRQGLLDDNIILGTALLDMYGKCGALTRARHMLEELSVRNTASWNALICGYAEHGQGEKALSCYEQMQHEGVSPDEATFMCVLKACVSIQAAKEGEQIHNDIAKLGLLETSIILSNALIDMYVKCGSLTKAQQVLEEMPERDVISWCTLIAGYSRYNKGEEALICFEWMQEEGLTPSAVTFLCILKACGQVGALGRGRKIHTEISKQGLVRSNVALGNALIGMYAECGALDKAQELLEELSARDVVSWNVLIAAYVQQGQMEQALNCFEKMCCEGLSPDRMTLLSIVKACGGIQAGDEGMQSHAEILRLGVLANDTALGNALVDMYVKCGALSHAQCVLEQLRVRDRACWNALVAGFAEKGQHNLAMDCFEKMQGEGLPADEVTFACILKSCGSVGALETGEKMHDEIVRHKLLGKDGSMLGNHLINMYVKCGALSKAEKALEELPVRDVISSSTLIAGHAQQGHLEPALNCLDQMRCEGLSPNEVTLACLLKACGSSSDLHMGGRLHDEITRNGLLEHNIVLGTALIDMYAKCGALMKAQGVLEELPVRNIVCWSALIAGYAHERHGEEALECFEQLQLEGLSPNGVTLVCILKACASIGATDTGKQIHDEMSRQGLVGDDYILGTALVDMYAKGGALQKARQVLEELPVRDVVAWNPLIAGYAEQSQGGQALGCFEQMQYEGLCPDTATFSSVLRACGLLGLVEDAQMYFLTMTAKYSVKPDLQHLACMVNLLGRVGHLDKAVVLMQNMPLSSYEAWSTLLSACQKWGDVKVGRWAFEHAVHIDRRDAAAYVLMADMYSLAGMQQDVERIEAMRVLNEAWRRPAQQLRIGWDHQKF